jgi:hypothetical protein
MPHFLPRKHRSTHWIKGAWSDWLKPYKCNIWFQFGHGLFFVSVVKICVFFETKTIVDLQDACLLFVASMVILALTEFGRGTVQGYRRARKIIERDGKFQSRIQAEFGRKLYCFRAGARAAAIDYGVQQELIPVLANKWRPW